MRAPAGLGSPRQRPTDWNRSEPSEPQITAFLSARLHAATSPARPRGLPRSFGASVAVVISRKSPIGTAVSPRGRSEAITFPARAESSWAGVNLESGPNPAVASAIRSITTGHGPASRRVNHSSRVCSRGRPRSTRSSSVPSIAASRGLGAGLTP